MKVAFGCRAGDGDAAGRRVVDVGDGVGGGGGDALSRALAVGVGDDDPDRGADIGIAEGVGRLIATDIDEAGAGVALPLVA